MPKPKISAVPKAPASTPPATPLDRLAGEASDVAQNAAAKPAAPPRNRRRLDQMTRQELNAGLDVALANLAAHPGSKRARERAYRYRLALQRWDEHLNCEPLAAPSPAPAAGPHAQASSSRPSGTPPIEQLPGLSLPKLYALRYSLEGVANSAFTPEDHAMYCEDVEALFSLKLGRLRNTIATHLWPAIEGSPEDLAVLRGMLASLEPEDCDHLVAPLLGAPLGPWEESDDWRGPHAHGDDE